MQETFHSLVGMRDVLGFLLVSFDRILFYIRFAVALHAPPLSIIVGGGFSNAPFNALRNDAPNRFGATSRGCVVQVGYVMHNMGVDVVVNILQQGFLGALLLHVVAVVALVFRYLAVHLALENTCEAQWLVVPLYFQGGARQGESTAVLPRAPQTRPLIEH